MRALIIREPWISEILAGTKQWEIRMFNTRIRGRIGLIRSGSGLIVGTAELCDAFELHQSTAKRAMEKHGMTAKEIRNLFSTHNTLARIFPYAWVLKDPSPLAKPIPYRHPRGAITWVTIPEFPIASA